MSAGSGSSSHQYHAGKLKRGCRQWRNKKFCLDNFRLFTLVSKIVSVWYIICRPSAHRIWRHITFEGWYIIPRGNILSNSLSGGSINTIGKTSKHSDGKTSKTEAKQAIILMAKQLFLVLSLLTASFWYSCKLISLLCRGNTL